MPGELIEHQGVVGRFDDDGNIGVVLGRGADHGRPADVDILDAIVEARAARDGLLERIEIDDQKIDGADVMGAHRFGMRGIAADGEKPAMHGRMQRLDAAVHHFRKAGQFGHVARGKAGLAQRLARAAGRDQLDSVAGKSAGEFDDPGFVGDGEKGTRCAAKMFGHGGSWSFILHRVAQAESGRRKRRGLQNCIIKAATAAPLPARAARCRRSQARQRLLAGNARPREAPSAHGRG